MSAREHLRDKLARDVAAFTQAGGVIEELAPDAASAWNVLKFNPSPLDDMEAEMPQGTHGVIE